MIFHFQFISKYILSVIVLFLYLALPDQFKIWKKEDYCVSYVEDGTKYYEQFHACKGKESIFLMMVSLQIIPGLLMISMIFLVLTFGLLFREQREKLFG